MSIRRKENQSGAVLVVVMVVTVIVMLVASTVVNHYYTNEALEVEQSLADVRVYWASMGHLNYALSRAATDGLCGATSKSSGMLTNQGAYCDEVVGTYPDGRDDEFAATSTSPGPPFTHRTEHSRAGSIQDYLDGGDELHSGGTIENPGSYEWIFPTRTSVDSNYRMNITGLVRDRDNSTEDGGLRIDFKVDVGEAPVPALASFLEQHEGVTIAFCVEDQKDVGTASVPSYTSLGKCGTATAEGESRIQFIRRQYPYQ